VFADASLRFTESLHSSTNLETWGPFPSFDLGRENVWLEKKGTVMSATLTAAIAAFGLAAISTHASFIDITHVVEGPPVIDTDGFAAGFGVLPEWALGSLLMPTGSVPLGPDGTSFHVVLFTDPATSLPTALVTLQASKGATDIFMYISFAALGGPGFASETAAYQGQPFTSMVPADGTLHDISPLLASGALQFGARVSPVAVSDSGRTAPLLAFSVLLACGLASKQIRKKYRQVSSNLT
jgi:hypothetical protein